MATSPFSKWIHTHLGICCLTGRLDIHTAHVGGLAQGKGMGIKCDEKYMLPLDAYLHLHADHRPDLWPDFWANALPGEDHLAWAERLFDCFEKDDRDSGLRLLMDMQDIANRTYLATILRRAA